MAEGRKRCRKSKLEVRVEEVIDLEEKQKEKSYLQKLPKLAKKPIHPPSRSGETTPNVNIFDHTYSRNNVSPSTSPIKLSVKVEVEEFDESIMNTDSQSTNVCTNSQLQLTSKKKSPNKINTFQIDIEKMFKVVEHIIWSSTNEAEKYLGLELKNIWGRVLKEPVTPDPYNEMIQLAIQNWSTMLVNGIILKETPLFYQCLICNLSWWYLDPFRDHIRTHNAETLKVYHQENQYESNIVAGYSLILIPKYIDTPGDCYRCGNPFQFHIRKNNEMYTCRVCNVRSHTCSSFHIHQQKCNSRDLDDPKSLKCPLCFAKFLWYTQDLDKHMSATHSVRSDVPVAFAQKRCQTCHLKFHNNYPHNCSKNALAGHCDHCYRKFQTRKIAECHAVFSRHYAECKICNTMLERSCMKTEHMMTHTTKYRLAYKCTTNECVDAPLFADEKSARIHKVVYHKQRYDKRRSNHDVVLVPEQCIKLDVITVEEYKEAVENGLTGRALYNPAERDQNSKAAENSGNMQTNAEISQKDIKTEVDDGEEMNYELMLAKMFEKPAETSSKQTEIAQVKTEPLGEDFESLIDSQNNPVIIKEEPIETIEIDDNSETENDCEIETSEIENDCVLETSEVGHDFMLETEVKTEPQDEIFEMYEGDLLNTIKSEPEDTGNQLQEATEMQVLDSIPIIREIRAADTEDKALKILLRTFKNNQSLLKYQTGNKKKIPRIIMPKKLAKPVAGNTTQLENLVPSEVNIKTEPEDIDPNIEEQIDQMNVSLEPDEMALTIDEGRFDENTEGGGTDVKTRKKIRGRKPKRVYTCAKCGYTNSHRLFKIHKLSHCEVTPAVPKCLSKTYTCTKCERHFNTLKSYLLHFVVHGYGPLQCPCCKEKFENLKDFIPHFNRHLRQNFVNFWRFHSKTDALTKKQHRCLQCRESVNPEEFFSHWENHLTLTTETESPPPTPHVGGEKQGTDGNTKKLKPCILHDALHRPEYQDLPFHWEKYFKEKLEEKTKISAELIDFSNLKTPAHNILNQTLQQLRSMAREKKCHVCSRVFDRRNDCKRHIIEHLLLDAYTKKHAESDICLTCQICGVGFVRGEQYKFHMREHAALPVYRCDLCNKTFSDSSNFAKHKKVHSLKVLICDICKKKFHAKTQLVKHIILHQVTQPIQCKHCDRSFFTQSMYRKHLHSRHDKRSRFKCILCDVWFSSLRQKWDHAWTVHKERRFLADCPVCQKKYRKYADVKIHARMHHGIDVKFFSMKKNAGKSKQHSTDDTLCIY